MQKTKTIKTFQRKTKSGKMSTVKEHSAKYDSADDMAKEAMKKRAGAGSEMEKRRKPLFEEGSVVEDYHKKMTPEDKSVHNDLLTKVRALDRKHTKSGTDLMNDPAFKKITQQRDSLYKKYDSKNNKSDKKELSKKEFEGAKFPKGTKPAKETKTGSVVVNAKGYKTPTAKTSTPAHGVSADEYKAWYHWDQKADPKNKVALSAEKKMKAHMGAKAYNKHFQEASDSYSARGHGKSYSSLSESKPAKVSPTAPIKKEVKKENSSSTLNDGKSSKSWAKQGVKQQKFNTAVSEFSFLSKLPAGVATKVVQEANKNYLKGHSDGSDRSSAKTFLIKALENNKVKDTTKKEVSPQKQKFTPNRRPTREEEARAEKKVNALVTKDKDVIGASDIRKQMGIPPTKAAKKESPKKLFPYQKQALKVTELGRKLSDAKKELSTTPEDKTLQRKVATLKRQHTKEKSVKLK